MALWLCSRYSFVFNPRSFDIYLQCLCCRDLLRSEYKEMTATGFVHSGKVPIAVLCTICGAELFSFTCTLFCVFSPYATKLCGARAVVVYDPRFLCVLSFENGGEHGFMELSVNRRQNQRRVSGKLDAVPGPNIAHSAALKSINAWLSSLFATVAWRSNASFHYRLRNAAGKTQNVCVNGNSLKFSSLYSSISIHIYPASQLPAAAAVMN